VRDGPATRRSGRASAQTATEGRVQSHRGDRDVLATLMHESRVEKRSQLRCNLLSLNAVSQCRERRHPFGRLEPNRGRDSEPAMPSCIHRSRPGSHAGEGVRASILCSTIRDGHYHRRRPRNSGEQWRQAYASLTPALTRFARRALEDREEAEDAVAVCWAKAAAVRYRGGRVDLDRPWMFTVLRHVLIDTLRAKRRWSSASMWLRHEAGGADDGIVYDLPAALAKLPATQREIVRARLVEGESYASLAERYRVKVATVRSNWS